MSGGGRIGLLGGTFDPPHLGHLVVAQDVLERLALDRLIVTPAARPPHREAVLDAETRLHLVREAFSGDARIEVSDAEVRRPGPSYTVDTLEWIRKELAPEALYLIMGTDQLRSFRTWHDPDRILELAKLAVMSRPGDAVEASDVPHEVVEVTRVELSATSIRRRLAAGLSVRYLVPESLRGEIEQAWAAHMEAERN